MHVKLPLFLIAAFAISFVSVQEIRSKIVPNRKNKHQSYFRIRVSQFYSYTVDAKMQAFSEFLLQLNDVSAIGDIFTDFPIIFEVGIEDR